MHQFIRSLFIAGLAGWVFGGCSEKIEPKAPTYSQILTGTEKKSWKMVTYQIIDNGVASPVLPIAQAGPACIVDDLCTFYADADHKFEASEGATKCNPADNDIYVTDTWSLVNANATLDFYLPVLNGKFPWKIKNLTPQTLTIEYYFSDINASYRFTLNSITK